MSSNKNVRDLPQTVCGAVSFIIEHLSESYKEQLMQSEYDNLLNYNRFLGMNIRNSLGLWRGNDALMRSCLNHVKLITMIPILFH